LRYFNLIGPSIIVSTHFMKLNQKRFAVSALLLTFAACGSNNGGTPANNGSGANSTSNAPAPATAPIAPTAVDMPNAQNGINPDGSCTRSLMNDTQQLESEVTTIDKLMGSTGNMNEYNIDFVTAASRLQAAKTVCEVYSKRYINPSCDYRDQSGAVQRFDELRATVAAECSDVVHFSNNCDNDYLNAYRNSEKYSVSLKVYLNADDTENNNAIRDRKQFDSVLEVTVSDCEQFETKYSNHSCEFNYRQEYQFNATTITTECERFRRLKL
jgi:hypothetical protein